MKIAIINRKIVLSLVVVAATLLSCNDDFMHRPPKDRIVAEYFWNTVSDVRLFVNGIYADHIWGHNQDPTRAPFGIRGSALVYQEAASDNAYNSNQANVNVRLTDAWIVPAADNVLWNDGWARIRRINFFLNNYRSGGLPENVLRRYAGEVYFFKAWAYFRKVQLFGDVPWVYRDLNVDSPELFAPRTPRAEVMDSILMCINRAIEWLPPVTARNPGGRINRDMALFLKSRITLFEGTFRRYHPDLGLQGTADAWLAKSAAASRELMESGRYALYNPNAGVPGNRDYWRLFSRASSTLPSVPEAVLARTYNRALGVHHDLTRFYVQNNHMGFTALRGLVEDYLMKDGQPVQIGGAPGAFVYNPLWQGWGAWTELDNRDPRLTQTIMRPGEFASVFNFNTDNWGTFGDDIDFEYWARRNGIEYPILAQAGNAVRSGYRFIKHWWPDHISWQTAQSDQLAIEFRFAEILLNYAEARYELGTLTDAVLDQTINALRLRAGFDFAAFPNARLTTGNVPNDPRLDALFAEKLDLPISPMLREIRRERRVEMVLENLRYWDLMRWRAGRLLTVPMRGMKFQPQIYTNSDFAGAGWTDPVTGIRHRAGQVRVGTEVFVDSDGFLVIAPLSTNIPLHSGTLPWDDRRYFWPIPLEQLTLNPNLIQTPGW